MADRPTPPTPPRDEPRRVERAGTERREGTSDPDRLGGSGAGTDGVGTDRGRKITGVGIPDEDGDADS